MTRILEARVKSGLSQKEVALSLGVRAPSVWAWESGKTKPTAANLEALSRLYNVSVDYLLGGDEPETEDDSWAIRERLRRDPSYRLLFDAADKASPEHLRAAAAMLKALEGGTND